MPVEVEENMSRLIDGLKKLTQAMGFRAARQSNAAPSMLIIAAEKIKDDGSPAKNIAGADAILLTAESETGLTAASLQKSVKSLKDVPWGVSLDASEDDTAKLVEAGSDFLVFSPGTRFAAVPQDEKTGKVLEVESSMDDGLLRAVNDLPADAILVTDSFEESGGLVWHQLMIFRHLRAFIAKPLLVPVPADISDVELNALWEAGIDGIVVNVTGTEDLKDLRQMVGKLPPRSERKRGKTDVFLPHAGTDTHLTVPPDEEEEEDE